MVSSEVTIMIRQARSFDTFDIAREYRCVSSVLISSPLDPPELIIWYQENLDYDVVDERIGQVTPIYFDSHHDDKLMTSFHPKTRNVVRKAEKLGVTVTIENQMFDFLQEIHTQNMQEIGGIAKPKRFFRRIPEWFGPNTDFKIYVARIDSEPVAAVLMFYFNGTVEYFTPVIRREFRETQALSRTIFSAMCDASKAGFRRWNWGGTWLAQEGVHHFKKRWGAKDLPYYYFVKLYNSSLTRRSPREILEQYPNFYVFPFNMLASQHA